MTIEEIAFRRGWNARDNHPEDNVVAPVYHSYRNGDKEIVLWGEINEEVSYEADPDSDNMAVEYFVDGELEDGWAFEDEEAALACLTLLMCGEHPSEL